jgi:2'-hydroxyisoflavone reductase
MNLLVLGGTHFIGRHIVEGLLDVGHRVTTLNRGRSFDPLPACVERLRGDRDAGTDGLAALGGRRWDACIDVSGYTPAQVRASAARLHAAVDRYVFISAVSVYGDPKRRPVVETHPRLPPAATEVVHIDGATYGPLKVACENVVEECFGECCALLRPQVVVGPGDDRDRYTYWVQRAMQGGVMLAPGDGSDHVQVIDVRDLAAFARMVVERGLGGAFNLAGPRITWAEFMAIIGAERIVWVPLKIIEEAGLTFEELPLYRPEHGPRAGLMDVSSARAQAAGLKLTAPEITATDVKAWCRGRPYVPALPTEREADLLRLARP